MKININDIEIPADESILPELSRQLLDLLNNSYKAVYSRNLSAEDRDKLVAVSNQIIDINQDLLNYLYPDRPRVEVKYFK
jgi:hypothetical protein|tara:strand:+ start:652 stop:891 length:240 start_codon:yes stop_codon:yes gene_type:complete